MEDVGEIDDTLGTVDLDRAVALLDDLRAPAITRAKAVHQECAASSLPLRADAARGLAEVDGLLEMLAHRYHRAYERACSQAASAAPAADKAQVRRVALPLSRALGLHSLRLVGALRARAIPAEAAWVALGRTGQQMRELDLHDRMFPDPSPNGAGPQTARAAVALPLLLHLAELHRMTPDLAVLVVSVAARWAHKVSWRIDEGASRANPHGPTVRLASGLRARLDTHRLLAGLAVSPQEWARDLPSQDLTQAQLDGLAALRDCWSAAHVPARPVAGAVPELSVHFGVPGENLDMGSGAGAPAVGSSFLGRNRYSWGRYEQDTILRVSRGSGGGGDPLELVMAKNQRVRWVHTERQTLVVDRQHVDPPPRLDGLVAFRASVNQPGAQAPELRLSRIVGIQHLPARGAGRPPHRLMLQVWASSPRPVEVRPGGLLESFDGWLLPADPVAGLGTTLFLAPGIGKEGEDALVRDGERDLTVRVERRLAEGPGWERFLIEGRGSSRLD